MGKRAVASKRTTEQKVRHDTLKKFGEFERRTRREWLNQVRPLAIAEALSLLICISDIVLHDDYGFGKKRLVKFNERLLDYFDSIKDRYVTLDEIVEEVENITGVSYGLGEREVKTLEQFGMSKLTKDAALTKEQMEYIMANGKDRRAKVKA